MAFWKKFDEITFLHTYMYDIFAFLWASDKGIYPKITKYIWSNNTNRLLFQI